MSKKHSKDLSLHTIDNKHKQIIERFHIMETETIPELELEKEKLKTYLKENTKMNIDKYMDTKDKIEDIKKKVKELKYEKKKYFTENSKYIFHYFEEKKKISVGEEKKNVNVLNDFFRIKKNKEVDENILKEKTDNFKNYIQKYWKNVNNEIVNYKDFQYQTDICQSCLKGELVHQEDDGVLICNNTLCGKYIPYIVDSSNQSSKEPPNEVTYTAYIRLNHFKEILSQFQAKETTQIPQSVIDDIQKRIRKERIKNIVEELDYDKMREILKNLGHTKYFEHIQYINSIFGIKPPLMEPELTDTLCVLFIEIQQPWTIHCPIDRTNFFSYHYILYQLCVLVGQTQYLPYIELLKDHDKQLEQDMIWEKICKDLDWEYNPTV